jgi:hypothetical protein
LKVRQLDLANRAGKTVIQLRANDEDNGMFLLGSSDGDIKVIVTHRNESTGVILQDGKKSYAVTASSRDAGGIFYLNNKDGAPMLEAGPSDNNGAGIVFYDKQGGQVRYLTHGLLHYLSR